MSFKVFISLASWKVNGVKPYQQYEVDSINQLMDLLYNTMGTRFDLAKMRRRESPTIENQEKGKTTFIFTDDHENTVNVIADGQYVSFFDEDADGNEINGKTFEGELLAAAESKFFLSRSYKDFLKKILNPFRWSRHGLTFAMLITAIGIGTLSSGGMLPGLALLGITVGLPMLLIAGFAETIIEYRQAKNDLQSHAFAGDYMIKYGFFTYLGDVIKHWYGQHKGQAAIVGIGVVLFALALIFTIPYCVDPTGSFSFMSALLDHIVHFFSQGIDTLAVMPQFEFLSALQQPAVELGIAAGLLISSTLAVPLTLKNFIQGGYEVWDSKYRYEQGQAEDRRRGDINDIYNDFLKEENAKVNQHFLSNGCFLFEDSPYAETSTDDMKKVCEHERELVIR